jgi:hypothetical protein
LDVATHSGRKQEVPVAEHAVARYSSYLQSSPIVTVKGKGNTSSLAVIVETLQKVRILKVINHRKVWYGVLVKCSELN